MLQLKAIKIGSNLEKVIQLSEFDFQRWHSERKEATQRILHDYGLFASIPHLGYERAEHNMDAITTVKDQVSALKQGLQYLDEICKIRERYKNIRE